MLWWEVHSLGRVSIVRKPVSHRTSYLDLRDCYYDLCVFVLKIENQADGPVTYNVFPFNNHESYCASFRS